MNQDKLDTINNKLAKGYSTLTQERQLSTGLTLTSTVMAISVWQKSIKELEMSSSFPNSSSLSLSSSEPSMLQRRPLRLLLHMVMTMCPRPSSNASFNIWESTPTTGSSSIRSTPARTEECLWQSLRRQFHFYKKEAWKSPMPSPFSKKSTQTTEDTFSSTSFVIMWLQTRWRLKSDLIH